MSSNTTNQTATAFDRNVARLSSMKKYFATAGKEMTMDEMMDIRLARSAARTLSVLKAAEGRCVDNHGSGRQTQVTHVAKLMFGTSTRIVGLYPNAQAFSLNEICVQDDDVAHIQTASIAGTIEMYKFANLSDAVNAYNALTITELAAGHDWARCRGMITEVIEIKAL